MNERLTMIRIGEIVANDARAAAIFEELGIDFCCGGGRTLQDACRAAGVEFEEVARTLEELPAANDGETNVAGWPIGRLIDYIVSTHHVYVRSALPIIARHLETLVEAHGSRHPELVRVSACFDRVACDLEQHLLKEEQVLFPYVRELAATAVVDRHIPSPFGSVENPIRMMEREHRDAGDAMRTIRELTNGFAAPEDGCATYALCMAELQRFESDLHEHVHLENNVLFPRAFALESGDRENRIR